MGQCVSMVDCVVGGHSVVRTEVASMGTWITVVTVSLVSTWKW